MTGMGLKVGCVYRGCSLTAWHALFSVARLQSGDSVLIHSAAGAIGIMASQLARNAGGRVLGLAGGEAKVSFVESFGGRAIDYRRAGWEERALEANSARPFDVILDGNGGSEAVRNVDLIAPLGRLVFFGASAGSYADPVPGRGADQQELQCRRHVAPGRWRALKGPDAERRIVEDLVEGRLKAPISTVRPLADVALLHAELENRALMGRVVIAVDPSLEP